MSTLHYGAHLSGPPLKLSHMSGVHHVKGFASPVILHYYTIILWHGCKWQAWGQHRFVLFFKKENQSLCFLLDQAGSHPAAFPLAHN